jgi:L,D-transpeptidase catalytic domain/Putative peptidoglycan binding domain
VPRIRARSLSRAGLAGVLAGLACAAALPGSAAGASSAGTPASAPASTPAPPPAPGAAAGTMSLALLHAGGTPPFALTGHGIGVRGTVAPFVAGQTVKVSIYRDGRRIGVRVLAVQPQAAGTGTFSISFRSGYPGAVEIRAAHYATAQQAAFSARTPVVRFIGTELGPGSSGQSVRLLQSELAALHYAVPLSGVFDEGTGQALVAFRKLNGLERVPYAGRQVFDLLARHAGSFHVRYRYEGRHVEADLTHQVLAEIEPGGRVHDIYMISSGKPSTPTVLGHFRVYLKTPGVNSEDMLDSNYFTGGYAIHGYPEVPTYAASHGCLRVPDADAPTIFAWVRYGTPVDVYY